MKKPKPKYTDAYLAGRNAALEGKPFVRHPYFVAKPDGSRDRELSRLANAAWGRGWKDG